jgi:hypothetical protein
LIGVTIIPQAMMKKMMLIVGLNMDIASVLKNILDLKNILLKILEFFRIILIVKLLQRATILFMYSITLKKKLKIIMV